MVNSGKKDAVEGKGLTLEKRFCGRERVYSGKKLRCCGRERVNFGKNKDAVEGKGLTLEKIKKMWKGKG